MERVVFLTLDNLSGDDSLSWMREAVPTAAAAQLTGVGRFLPLRADSSREAAALAATQMVHGYLDQRGGKLHFEFTVEDAGTHKVRALGLDADALHAADAAAKLLDAAAAPFSTQNSRALEAWGRLEFEKAVEIDADFGTAWRDLVQSRAAAGLAAQALARKSLRFAVERAQIQLLHGQLTGDSGEASRARADLVRLVPLDAGLLRRFAEEESNSRNFAQAAQFYQTLLRNGVADPTIGNLLGYAQFFAGDLPAARKSFQDYGLLPGQEANSLDSLGEVLFMAGQFQEAEALFLRAHGLSPAMLAGGDLLKAAHARWLSGDLPQADGIFENYMKYRTEHSDQNESWRRESWSYATGRSSSAPAAAVQVPALLSNLDGLERAYRSTPPAADGMVRVLYAKSLLKAGRKAEAAPLAALWPLPESGDPALQPLLYRLYLELKNDLAK